MYLYYLLVIIPPFLLFWVGRQRSYLAEWLWWVFFFTFVLVVGFRHNVGADWRNYISHYELTQGVGLIEALQTSDPGYAFLNWLSTLVDGGIYLVNVACAGLMLACLISFARREFAPWFFVSISVPFYIVIIGMSLTRQSVAIGFVLLAIRAVLEKKGGRFVFYIGCAALFHKSALILLSLYTLVNFRKTFSLVVGMVFFAALGAAFVLLETFESYYYYIEQEWESQGTVFRSIYLSIPGVLFIFFRRKLRLTDIEFRLGTVLALLSVASLAGSISSLTAIDRLLLYLTPFPPMVYTRLMLLFKGASMKLVYGMAIVFFHIVLLYVWLNYSFNSIAWIPYDNALFH